MATSAPSRPSASAMALPRPRPPPVTTAILPASLSARSGTDPPKPIDHITGIGALSGDFAEEAHADAPDGRSLEPLHATHHGADGVLGLAPEPVAQRGRQLDAQVEAGAHLQVAPGLEGEPAAAHVQRAGSLLEAGAAGIAAVHVQGEMQAYALLAVGDGHFKGFGTGSYAPGTVAVNGGLFPGPSGAR